MSQRVPVGELCYFQSFMHFSGSYADLKPPSSPSPTSSGPKEKASTSPSTDETLKKHSLEGNDKASILISGEEDAPRDSASYRSPYFAWVHSFTNYLLCFRLDSKGVSSLEFTFLFNFIFHCGSCGFRYENFKPPCSPSPSAPLAPSPSAASLDLSGNGAAKPSSPVEPPEDAEDHTKKTARPLSPYTM